MNYHFILLSIIRFVLVGDDYQLPPIVLSSEAQARGMDISLLKRLVEAHPEATICLTAQYRMNDDIMILCNTLIYESRMTCATPATASARLLLPSFPLALSSDNNSNSNSNSNSGQNILKIMSNNITDRDWLLRSLNPKNSVVFLNTDTMYETKGLSILKNDKTGSIFQKGFLTSSTSTSFSSSSTTSSSTRVNGKERYDVISNTMVSGTASEQEPKVELKEKEQYGVNVHPFEVEIVRDIVRGLSQCGFNVRKGKGLGVISPYRSQVRALRKSLLTLFLNNEINTADEPQAFPFSADMVVEKCVGRDVEVRKEEKVDFNECEVSTVDSFQGRDMDVVILSTVKNIVGELVRSMRVLYINIDMAKFVFQLVL